MDEETAPHKKTRKNTKAPSAAMRKATAATMDLAVALSDIAKPGARLVTDMPLGKDDGQVRLVLIEGNRRVSAWGKDMHEATRRLIEKASAR